MHPHEMIVRKSKDVFYRETGEKIHMSIDRSTRATYSLGNRAYYFEGVACKGTRVGDYVKRELDNNIYIVETRFIQPYCPKLDVIYMCMTNSICNLQRQQETGIKDEYDEWVIDWIDYAKGINVLSDTTVRSFSETNDGLLDSTIYLFTIPHKYNVKVLDRLVKTDEDGNIINKYRIDSINDTLVEKGIKLEGVIVVQASIDVRP